MSARTQYLAWRRAVLAVLALAAMAVVLWVFTRHALRRDTGRDAGLRGTPPHTPTQGHGHGGDSQAVAQPHDGGTATADLDPWAANHPLRRIKSETLTYALSARGGVRVNLGTVTLRLFREDANGERQLVIEAKATGGVVGYPLASTITSRLRDNGLCQIVADHHRTRPSYSRRLMRWTPDGVDYLKHRRREPRGSVWALRAQHRGFAPSRTYGIIAACYAVRGWGLAPGGPAHSLRVVFKRDLWDVSIRGEKECVIEVPAGKIPCYKIGIEATPVSEQSRRHAEGFQGPFGLKGKIDLYADKETKQLVLVRGEIEFGVTFEVDIMLTKRTAEAFRGPVAAR